MSTLRTNTLQNAAGSKSVPVDTVVDGTAKAWVNFNGTGTVAIRASFNVSSITDNGTGDYTVNFTTGMADANYAVAGLVKEYDSTTGSAIWLQPAAQTLAATYKTNAVRVNARYASGNSDVVSVNVVIYR